MRRLMLLVFVGLLSNYSIVLKANPVDMRTVREVAMKFVNANAKVPLRNADELRIATTYSNSKGTAAFYIFNFHYGFVIISADDVAHPVLGYGFDHSWPQGGELPSQVSGFLDDLANQIEAAADMGPDKGIAQEWYDFMNNGCPSKGNREQVGPLLNTTWDQGKYYNGLCPEDANGPDGHAWAGCVATAMAQIINYHSYPEGGRGMHGYSNEYGDITVNFADETYDYDLMPDGLTIESTEEEKNAVAQLMRDCGVAANMGYSPSESSSFDMEARAALINYFKYSPNMSFAEHAFFSNDEWHSMLRNDLDAGNPIYYSGKGVSGHAFVCDGYNSEGYFSFNYGWGGNCNGWYLTSAVSPGGTSYNNSQAAIFGIVPDASNNVVLGQMQGTSTFVVGEPLEFCHLLGNNSYTGNNYGNLCSNTVVFVSYDDETPLVADIIEFEDQSISFYDGMTTDNWLRTMSGSDIEELFPVVSSSPAMTIVYNGALYYPGFKLSIARNSDCRMVSNIHPVVDATTVHLTWIENGNASQWQVEYGFKGFPLGQGTLSTVTTNMITCTDLQAFSEYDFYIRPICDSDYYGLWNKVTVMVEAPYWQDIVTAQPEGYVMGTDGVIAISTAEGLAWWTRNECDGDARLLADIDLAGYKWRPVDLDHCFYGDGHVISNAYVDETYQNIGFFAECGYEGVIDNVGLNNIHVRAYTDISGGLCGTLRGQLRNCYITNSFINGMDMTGGLVGIGSGSIINCYANVDVLGRRWTGILSGVFEGVVRNCYAAGSVTITMYCYNAGIVAYSGSGEISNCYSVHTPMGVVGYEGVTSISDTSTFVRSDLGFTLMTPIIFDEVAETDLLMALNRGVALYNDSELCVWEAAAGNTNGGYPVLGDKYVVSCPNVSDVTVTCVREGNTTSVVATWTEQGDAPQWLLRYRRHGISDPSYTYVTTFQNIVTLPEITLGYVYDFNVRALCDLDNVSGWSETKTLIVDLPYWTDVVTDQPSGFVEDPEGNVEISSSEGLAWLSVLVNGFNGQPNNSFSGKTVTLTDNINLEGYRWYPIGRHDGLTNTIGSQFTGTFDGQGHTVSNIYVNDAFSDLGLFGNADGCIKNVIMDGGYVASIYTTPDDPYTFMSSGIGGLVGRSFGDVMDCHSSVVVYGNSSVGSLCGETYGTVTNCSASGVVFGRQGCGGLVGWEQEAVVRNCFATGDVNIATGGQNSSYRGGLVGYCQDASVFNGYSLGTVYVDSINSSFIGSVVGCPYLMSHVHNIFGQDDINPGMDLLVNYCEDITNTAYFHHGDQTNPLLTTVSEGGVFYSDLLSALNAWVMLQNDPLLRLWVLDPITGYPVFGDTFEPSCYNPTELTITNVTAVGDSVVRIELEWTQIGEPDYWEVLYVATGQSLDSGFVITAANNPVVLTSIPVGHPLDFYVRAVCGDDDVSQWSEAVTYLPDKLRWTEIVLSQPEGYTEDEEGNAYISSSEGLSWLSTVTREQENRFAGKRIELMADIDLHAYRWTPIHLSDAVFEGNGHIIYGLYCNELDDRQGLFGRLQGGCVSDVILRQCEVWGIHWTGGLVGCAYSADVINCAVEGDVFGVEEVGGVVGRQQGSCRVANSCFIGNASGRRDLILTNTIGGYVGGICGVSYYNDVVNCFVVCEIDDSWPWSGMVTGTGGVPNLVSNCYYKHYPTTLPVTEYSCVVMNNSGFSGSGNTWTFNTPPYMNGIFYSDLLNALNAWVDANNTAGQYFHWVADVSMVNGGFPILKPMGLLTSQSLTFTPGWNWFSSFIEYDENTLTNLQGQLDASGTTALIKSQNAFVSNESGTWAGSLDGLDNMQTYMVRLDNGVTVSLSGATLVASNRPVTLRPGWNWIGYCFENPMSLMDFLSEFEPMDGDIIKSQNAFASYSSISGWSGNLDTLEPGKGYLFMSGGSDNRVLNFPAQ